MLIFLCVNVQHEHVQKHEGTTMFNNAFFYLNNCLNNVPSFSFFNLYYACFVESVFCFVFSFFAVIESINCYLLI